MPRPTLIIVIAVATWAGACSDALPCSNCPVLAGSYEMSFEETSRAADCASLSPAAPPSVLDFTQVGSTGRTKANGLELVGTIYDTWDFTLTGTGSPDGGPETDSVSVRGHLLPPPSGTDGGNSMRGTWSQTAQGDVAGAARTCTVELSFTGSRR